MDLLFLAKLIVTFKGVPQATGSAGNSLPIKFLGIPVILYFVKLSLEIIDRKGLKYSL